MSEVRRLEMALEILLVFTLDSPLTGGLIHFCSGVSTACILFVCYSLVIDFEDKVG